MKAQSWDIEAMFSPNWVLADGSRYKEPTPEEIAASVRRFAEAAERAKAYARGRMERAA